MQNKRTHRLSIAALLAVWVATAWLLFVNQQRLIDWWKLRGYEPSTQIAALATESTMTEYGRHLFFVNKPAVVSGDSFTKQCPLGGEKTVVLGCYKANDSGIYLYKVTDTRLNGVVQVTASHEMLHAAYERLSTSERDKVDAMLESFYANGLQDERVKSTIEAYKTSEPSELVNEMHSIFGTEVAQLPADLETYYKQYFTNRATVAALTASYQAEFTSRQAQVDDYDAQLASLKQTIETNESLIASLKTQLDQKQQTLASLKAAEQFEAYNAQVPSYNQLVNRYNTVLNQTRAAIDQYNSLVEKRNAVALEEQQLAQSLSAQDLPSTK